MTKAKQLPTIEPSIHTFSIMGKIRTRWTKQHLEKVLQLAVKSGRYKWIGPKTITRRGGGLQVRLSFYSNDGGYVYLENINLPRLGGNGSYLSLTDLSATGLSAHQKDFETELQFLGIPWKSEDIFWTLNRLDLTQDFYVKSDPSLMIRNLRFAGETGLFRGMSPNHFKRHNEKHSARWQSRWYTVTIYDKHAEIKNRDKLYHNVPESDLVESKNRLRYEVSLRRESLRRLERKPHILTYSSEFSIEYGIKQYFLAISSYIPTILRNISSQMFGEYAWQRVAYVMQELEFAVDSGLLDAKVGRIAAEYLRCLESSSPFMLTPAKEQIIREVFDQLEVNRIIIPDRILTKRELCRFPCYPPGHFVQGEGNSIDFLDLPERPWEQRQRIHPILSRKS